MKKEETNWSLKQFPFLPGVQLQLLVHHLRRPTVFQPHCERNILDTSSKQHEGKDRFL